MGKRFCVCFYDMIDGWGTLGWYGEYDTLEEAKIKCDEEMKTLDDSNKRAGEHYGVIDRRTGFEVYCTRQGGF